MYEAINAFYAFIGVTPTDEMVFGAAYFLILGPVMGAMILLSFWSAKKQRLTANSTLMKRAYVHTTWEEHYKAKVSMLVRPAKEAFVAALQAYGNMYLPSSHWKLFENYVLLRAAADENSDFVRFLWVPMKVFDNPEKVPEIISQMVWDNKDCGLEDAQAEWEEINKK
jgi:hypothetical protein